ncbi:probable DNA mismatch repair protein Msh6 [Coccinella septempunctata]|uniref:probable DNA mismatch repair protein Msh6 n=1 Tax=Coccinella septempunctata TaxID=41139 RepID=UPI001D09420C|nr:probable DNA mismatch repair protein Msh6 [Coccinella septempunctata]
MSKTPKRKSLGGQTNTLFSYFKSPKVEKKDELVKETLEEKPISPEESDDEEIVKSRKRKRIIIHSDSEDEGESGGKKAPKIEKFVRRKSEEESEGVGNGFNDSSENDDKTHNGSEMKGSLEKFSFEYNQTADKNKPTDDILKDSQIAMKMPASSDVVVSIHNNWKHNHLAFLQPDKIKDKNKRRPDHPEYDNRTLFIPDDFLNNQTPAMRQWWILKSSHMDTVLFFKVGKFYELYHMDAVVGVQQLGFSYMKGEFAHSGFPESAYAKMASILIEKGFKVARVEQTETPEMMAERCKLQKKTTKYDKVVKREICQISTKATLVYSAQMPDATQAMSSYLYAIAEKKIQNGVRFGVCFVDTSIGIFHLSEFEDDKHCSRLLALCAEYKPELILVERGRQSSVVSEVFNTYFKDIRKENLAPTSQFLTADKTLESLSTGPYFKDKSGQFAWPQIFSEVAEECIPKSEYELTLKCLGACLWYLRDSELDIHVFSMKQFKMYTPKDLETNHKVIQRDYMVLDAVSMDNLNLLGGQGSLQKNIDYCETPFGKRLLHQWICRPLCDVDKIKERQTAVKELASNTDFLKPAQEILKKLPDLERQIAKIHIYGNKYCAENHPDGRAIFYESKTYTKRKIHDLLNTLRGFESAQGLTDIFKGCESRLLKKITQTGASGMYLDLSESLQFFREAFDQEMASKDGVIIPKAGVDEDYDAVMDKIANIQKSLDKYLKEQEKYFGCKISYFGSDKKRFQLEIPDTHTRKVTSDYQLEGTKKGNKPCKRYHTEETRGFLSAMLKAEGEKAKIIQDLNRRIFEKFSQRYSEWEQVTHCIMYLDVLCSIATYSTLSSHAVCLPEIRPFHDKSMICIKNARHPCITNIENFVPNDISMNCDDKAGLVLITGPNMGGKSTLMRQVAVIAVMAQMGAFVPAEECTLNLVDRVFTRLGAHDNIIGGQSTFFVELSEASSILQHASPHSLVLLDELGRGTSTHDGNAIATAYVKKLLQINCRTLFSTHYHTLVDHFVNRTDVQLGHMACMVENDEDPTQESVVFLYKMVEGRCPKSYGFNAARLAGLKHSIVSRAREIAKVLENQSKGRDIFRKIFCTSEPTNLRMLISYLKNLKF